MQTTLSHLNIFHSPKGRKATRNIDGTDSRVVCSVTGNKLMDPSRYTDGTPSLALPTRSKFNVCVCKCVCVCMYVQFNERHVQYITVGYVYAESQKC